MSLEKEHTHEEKRAQLLHKYTERVSVAMPQYRPIWEKAKELALLIQQHTDPSRKQTSILKTLDASLEALLKEEDE